MQYCERVVVQSSVAHYLAEHKFGFARYFSKQGDRIPSASYADSKLANILCAQAFQKIANNQGLETHYLSTHPGYLVTNINRKTLELSTLARMRALLCGNTKPLLMALAKSVGVIQPSPYYAALPLLYAAFEKRPTRYTGPQGLFGMTGRPGPARLSKPARNCALAQQLYLQTQSYCIENTYFPELWV
jgi:hypothetical protein